MQNVPVTRDTRTYFVAVLAPLLIAAGLQMGASPASAVAYGGYTDWRVISAGGSQTCGIRATGQLYCWGTDGTGSTLYPVASARDWRSVSVGEAHQCAIRSTGLLYCWGSDSNGQVGNGGSGAPSTPARIGSNTSWRWVSAGGSHTCGTLGTGALYCWGSDAKGQLGNGAGSTSDASYPRRVGTSNGWKSVDAGGEHTCGLSLSGALYCWGSDDDGQIGTGSAGPPPSPTRIGTAAWSSVSAGGSHTCAVSGGRTMYCWGDNTSGQIGDGTATDRPTPRKIGATGVWTTVSTGGTHTCAITTGRTMYCWGNNDSRQSVDSSSTTSFTKPQRLVGTASWRLLDAGARHTCGAPTSGRIYCWGAQRPPSNGLPAGTKPPAQVLDLRRWKLTIPYDGSDSGSTADEIKWGESPDLATYRSLSHFHSTSDNKSVVFRAPVGGAKTGGSVFARSELRERTLWDGSNQSNCDWSNQSGTHSMSITQRVTHLPRVVPRVVVGQIHDPRDEVVMIRVDGSSIIAEASYPHPDYEDGRKVQKPLTTAYNLGTFFTIRISAGPGGVAVFYNEGKSDAKTAWFEDRVSRNASPDKETGDGWYFKAGLYLQSNTAKGDTPYEYGEGVISRLVITHPSGVCS